MTVSPLRRFLHRILVGSGPVLLLVTAIYQLVVWGSERLWFESLGYGTHFGRLFAWRLGSFMVGAAVFALWLGFNAHLAWRNSARRAVPLSFFQSDDRARLIPLEDKLQLDRYRRRATIFVVAALSWLVGLGCAARASLFVRAFWAQGSSIRDTASNFDLAFFLFTLPCVVFISRFLLLGLVAALLLAAAIYLYEESLSPRHRTDFGLDDAPFLHEMRPSETRSREPNERGTGARQTRRESPQSSRAAANHLAVLWAMLLIWKGLDCVLGVPRSFVSSGGVGTRVFDPLDISFGWTSAGLFAFSAPLIALMSGLAVARAPKPRTFALGALWMLCAGAFPTFLPLVIARTPQTPGWTEALSRHIQSTRRAWNLGAVTQRSFAASPAPPFRVAMTSDAAPLETAASASATLPTTNLEKTSSKTAISNAVTAETATADFTSPETAASKATNPDFTSNKAATYITKMPDSALRPTTAPLPLWSAAAAKLAFNRRLAARGESLRVAQVYLERAGANLVYRGLALPPAAFARSSTAPDSEAVSAWRARHERAARGVWQQLEASRVAPDGTPIFLPDTDAPTLFGASITSETAPLRSRDFAGATLPDDFVALDSDAWILARDEVSSGGQNANVAGVKLGDWSTRTLLAARFFEPLLARETDANDRLIWHRGAAERCRQIAPFLDWRESEARPVLLGADFGARGELKWLVPGLVWSDDYPDSAAPQSAALGASVATPENLARGGAPAGANYGRQIALGVVDGRSGAVTLYALDPSEPFMALYARAFPDVFQLPTSIPSEIRAEIRPSHALLRAQTQIWSRYHDGAPLSWLAHRADFRPLLLSANPLSRNLEAAPPTLLASAPSGDWDLMAYARPEGQTSIQAPQVQTPVRGGELLPAPAASPLAAILGFDERAFAANPAAPRFVQWQPRTLLPLPALLIESLEKPLKNAPPSDSPGSFPPFSAPLLSVAPNLAADGEARGLLISRGELARDDPKTGAAPSPNAPAPNAPLRLRFALQISGPIAAAVTPVPARKAPLNSPVKTRSSSPAEAAPISPAGTRLQLAREAWLAVQTARRRADWSAVARAGKEIGRYSRTQANCRHTNQLKTPGDAAKSNADAAKNPGFAARATINARFSRNPICEVRPIFYRREKTNRQTVWHPRKRRFQMNKFFASNPKCKRYATLASVLFALSGAAFTLSALFAENSHHLMMLIPAVLMFLNSILYFCVSRAAS